MFSAVWKGGSTEFPAYVDALLNVDKLISDHKNTLPISQFNILKRKPDS